jgi:hypothetical protein
MHDKIKQKIMSENTDSFWNMMFVQLVSGPIYDLIAALPHDEQRFIKTHLPFKLLPPSVMEQRAKVVYIARHPRDVVVSYFHLNKLYRPLGFVNDFESFCEYFMNDLCE